MLSVRLTDSNNSYEKNYVQYSVDYVRTMTALESSLHSCEDPVEIAITTLKIAAEFYDGDWCGVIEGDLEMEVWAPVLWYNVTTQTMSPTKCHELEDMDAFQHWMKALHESRPVIISDTSLYKESNPAEYEIYRRCNADSILAVPFWKTPVGFMIVRNPKRYHRDPYESGFLQALAFVAFSAITEQKLISRIQNSFSPDTIKNDKDIYINLFGKLEIHTSKGVLTETEISSPRICRFLVYMILHGKYPVPPRTILEKIWPEEESESAGTKIKSLAYRFKNIFELISDYKLIVSTPMGYQINPELNIMTDIQKFEEYVFQAQSTLTMKTKIELLKKAAELYRGNIYDVASYEHWLLTHELFYKYKCLGVYVELMRTYYDIQDYSNVLLYASLALKLEKTSVDAYYWMIRAMRQRDSLSMAKGELKLAEHVLTSEEYEELLQKLEKTKDLEI